MNALTFYAQRLPARDEYTHCVGLTQDSIGEGCGGFDDVFAIVEHHQHVLVLQVLDDRRHRFNCRLHNVERGMDGA